MLHTLFRNIASNWIGFVIQVTIVFFLTPFVIHSLGDIRYGIWVLVTSFTGYYGLLDIGFRAGITQYLTRYLATEDFNELNCTASTAVVASACCGMMVGLLSFGIALISSSVFNIPADTIPETRWCIIVIGLSTAIRFPFFTFFSVFTATQRYDLENVVGVGTRLVIAAGIILALKHGYGLITLCLVEAAAELLGTIVRWRIAYRILPQLRIAKELVTWKTFWSVANFGLWSFIADISYTLMLSAGYIIIGIFMPISAITSYNLAFALTTYFYRFFNPIARVFFPAATQLDAQGDIQRLRQMYLVGSKMLTLLALPVTMIGILWANDFFRLWVGKRFVEGNNSTSVAVLFWLLISSAFVTVIQQIGWQILMGRRRLKQLALMTIGEMMTSILLSISLVQEYGLAGVGVGVLISAIIFRGIVYPIVMCRGCGILGRVYLQSVCLRPCLVGIVLSGALAVVYQVVPFKHNWTTLSLTGVVAVAISLPLLLFLGLDGTERETLVIRPTRRLLAWLQRDKDICATREDD